MENTFKTKPHEQEVQSFFSGDFKDAGSTKILVKVSFKAVLHFRRLGGDKCST